jgi:excisionase family DNA binding protein
MKKTIKSEQPELEAGTRCYSIAQIQKMVPLGKTRIYQCLAAGQIPCIRLGKRFIVPRKKFDEWLDSGGTAA